MDRIEEKYEIAIEKVYSVLSPEEQERTHGNALWTRDPDLCCGLRKVEPLRRKLGGRAERMDHQHSSRPNVGAIGSAQD